MQINKCLITFILSGFRMMKNMNRSYKIDSMFYIFNYEVLPLFLIFVLFSLPFVDALIVGIKALATR